MAGGTRLALLAIALLALPGIAYAWGVSLVYPEALPVNASHYDVVARPQQRGTIDSLLATLELAKRQNAQLRESLLRAQYHTPVLISSRFDGKAYGWQACTALLGTLLLSSLAWSEVSKRKQLWHKDLRWKHTLSQLVQSKEQLLAQMRKRGASASGGGASGANHSQVRMHMHHCLQPGAKGVVCSALYVTST